MLKKISLLICLVIFLSAITYGLVHAGVVIFVDGVSIQYPGDNLTEYEDQVPSRAEAESLLMPLSGSLTPSAHLEKNAGGCRIRLGSYSNNSGDYAAGEFFWQGYFWGTATTTPTTSAANSCICPTGTTRVLRRSQDNNQISSLDTTWWKSFYYDTNIQYVASWTTQCTQFYKSEPFGCHHGDPGCSCYYNVNNCLNRTGYYGCGGVVNFNYTEYLYNCVANSETLKQ